MIKTCPICGKEFEYEIKNSRPPKYCSKECAKEAVRFQQKMKREQERDKKAAERGMSKVASSFNETLKRIKAEGKTYSQWQQEQTLELVRKGLI